MNQIYDPLRYVDRTGEGVAQIGSQVLGTLSNFFQQNAQWKQFRTNQKSDDDAKASVYNTTLKLLQEKGIDPAQINIPVPTDKRITPEDYTAKLAESIQSAFVGSGAKLDQGAASQIGIANQPGVKESLAQQSFLDKNDSPNQIDLNGMAGTPAPAGVPVSDSTEQVNPMLQDILGAQQSAPAEEDEVGKYFDPLAKALIEDVRGGRLSAQAASTEMKDILKLKAQAQLVKAQKDRDDAKALDKEKRDLTEKAGAGLVNARISDLKIVSKATGKEVDISPDEALKHPELFAISKEHAQWKPSSSWGPGGGVPKNPDEIKLQKAVIERLRQMNAGDFTLVNKEDAMGNIIPTYVPKPNSQSAQILGNPTYYNEFVTKFLPRYSKAVGIEPPVSGTARGSGF